MSPDPATVDRVRVPSWPDAWLRICASFGLAGWLLVSCIVPAIFALWTATNLERALRTVVVIAMVPYMSATVLFPVNAILSGFLLRRISLGLIAFSARVRGTGVVLSVLGTLSNATLCLMFAALLKDEDRPVAAAALIWMITTSALGAFGGPFLLAALLRMGRSADSVKLA
ncbi:MAG: hypothetical protein ACJ790_06735 [Myxococcaceae bacterium]